MRPQRRNDPLRSHINGQKLSDAFVHLTKITLKKLEMSNVICNHHENIRKLLNVYVIITRIYQKIIYIKYICFIKNIFF